MPRLSRGYGNAAGQHRKTGELCVAKCYSDKSLLSRHNEAELLKKLSHPGLPAYIGEYENDACCVYCANTQRCEPLDRYAAGRRLTEEEAVSILMQLCGLYSPTCTRKRRPSYTAISNRKTSS